MYCRTCGSSMEEGTSFCTNCGTPVENALTLENPDANAAAAPDKNVKLKKPIVGLAVAALVLTFVSALLYKIANYHWIYQYGVLPRDFINYVSVRFFDILFSLLIPTAVAALFVLFCCLIGKKPLLLTGIPMIVSMALSLITFILNIFSGIRLITVGNLVTVLSFILSVLFIVFYMLAVCKKIKGTAGKALTITFASIIRLISLVSMVVNVVSCVRYYGITDTFTLLNSFGNILGFISGLLTSLAMILCVFYGYGSESKTERRSYQAIRYAQPQMFCPVCGIRFPQGKRFCDQCGSGLSQVASADVSYGYPVDPQDAPSGGYAALGFFFPVVGLILFLSGKDRFPLRSGSAGKGALAGVITSVALSVLSFIIYFIWLSTLLR